MKSGTKPTLIVGRQESGTRRSMSVLVGLLALVLIAWFATWPMRSRLTRRTEQIDRQVAVQQAEINRREALKTALQTAQSQVNANPGSLNARLSLAGAELQAGQYLDAARDLHAAVVLQPGNPRPYDMLGALYDRLGMPDLAVIQYRLALQKAPGDSPALIALAYKYVTFGWNDAATQLIKKGLKIHPRDPDLHAALSLVAFQTGDQSGAEKELLLAQRLNPHDITLRKPLIEVYRRSGRYQAALGVINRLPAADAMSPIFLLERAQIYLQMAQPEQAMRWANRALSQQPQNMDALYARAAAERALGRTADEQRDLQAVYQQAPATGQTRLLLGQMLVRQGQAARGQLLMKEYADQTAETERMLRLVLKVAYNSHDPGAHLQMANALLAAKDPARAIVEYRRTLELQPGNRAAMQSLIRALRQVKRSDEAASLQKDSVYHAVVRLAD